MKQVQNKNKVKQRETITAYLFSLPAIILG